MKKINCILLIDDNPADNTFHKFVITKADVCDTVMVTSGGMEALEFLKKSAKQSESFPTPELIFLDINMPAMNGFEFLEEYQKLDEEIKSKVVIVMISTTLSREDLERAMEFSDVTQFTYKPFTVDVVKEVAEKYFKN